jgi:high frequency lysogenization protein
MKTERDRIIALAGIFQAASLVEGIARRGNVPAEPLKASIYSLFQVEAPSVEAVYGDLAGLTRGLTCLRDQLVGGSGRSIEIVRYVLSLLDLERKAAKRPQLVDRIAQGIGRAGAHLELLELTHPAMLSDLAEIYSTSIGTLQPRIMVHGEPRYLSDSINVARIRSLLLAGIRSVLLWRQCGGTRLGVLLQRRRLLRGCERLLGEA